MSVLPLVVFVGVSLLAGPSARSPLPDCEVGSRHVELTADTPGEPLEVCVRPGLPTSFLFDARLVHVELARREWFRVMADEAGFTLVPTVALGNGERVPLMVSFQDGAAPASATFTLVVHPSEAARLVEVTRQPRTLASYREGEQMARAEARQCRQEKARLETECAGRTGVLGLYAQKLLGERGITTKNLVKRISSRSGNRLRSARARSYRLDTRRVENGRKVVRLLVEQQLENQGSTPWTPAGAVLVGPKGVEWKVLGVWPLEPIAPGKQGDVAVEVEATEEAVRGTFTLKLWSEDGGPAEFFDGVTFP